MTKEIKEQTLEFTAGPHSVSLRGPVVGLFIGAILRMADDLDPGELDHLKEKIELPSHFTVEGVLKPDDQGN